MLYVMNTSSLISSDEASHIKSSFKKSKLEKVTEYKINCHSYPGKLDAVAPSKFPTLFLLHKLAESVEFTEKNISKKDDNYYNDKVLLQKTAGIIRKEKENIPRADTYFLANEVSLQ